MKTWMKRLGLGVLVVVMAMGVVSSVSAQGPDGGPPKGGPGGRGDGPAGGPRAFVVALDEASDLNGQDIRALLDEGKTLAEIAAENGIDASELEAAVLADLTEKLQADVDAGRITQDDMDQALADAGQIMTQPQSEWPQPIGLGRPDGANIGPRGFIAALDEASDLSAEEIRAMLDEGKTLAEIAEENGIDASVIEDAVLADLAEKLQAAVDEGKITQEDMDQALAEARRIMTQPQSEWPQPENRDGQRGPGGRDGQRGPGGPGGSDEQRGPGGPGGSDGQPADPGAQL